ncbi:protease adaptor protein RcdA [soil metagenome]
MNDLLLREPAAEEGAISFTRGFVKSDAFMALFREGMGLVEQTAAYLDGDGRAASAALPREVALTYATESMRLTTRLMQIASWLLVQRAVAEGEMTAEQARAENDKVRIPEQIVTGVPLDTERLPQGLRDLMDHSFRLQARIRHLEGQMSGKAPSVEKANPVQDQLASLQARLGLAR